ncbi:hypothetical protein [Bdellovibrio bacteriovorus]|uniref:hypothetical protein n=1 Tax=Bdellovibrio TaxID=958 RepID=UPI0035A98D82
MNRYVLALLISTSALTGCGLEASLENLAGLSSPKLPPGIELPKRPVAGVVTDPEKSDFLNTEILVGSHGIADGQTILQIVVRLMNSDNTVVAGYVPEYSITNGTGVIKGSCTASDNFGVSVCSLRSTDSGIKTVRLENTADFHPEKDVVFDAPVKEATTIGSSGGDVHEASDPKGWRMTASVGTQYDKVIVQKNGYQLRLGPVGSVTE